MAANAANAQHSTGPVTDIGKANSSLNRLTHGLAGHFRVLPWEDQADFDALLAALRDEYAPETATEHILVQKAAEHHWFSGRAVRLQESLMPQALGAPVDSKALSLYVRYQTTNDRAFQRCIQQLRSIKNDRRREQVGFESQKRAVAAEIRRQEIHEARLRELESRTRSRDLDSDIRQTIEAPLPGHMRVPFDAMKDAFRFAVHEVNRNMAANGA
jgi:hypothetical protein